jgi:hypothetical protein
LGGGVRRRAAARPLQALERFLQAGHGARVPVKLVLQLLRFRRCLLLHVENGRQLPCHLVLKRLDLRAFLFCFV